MGVNPRIQATSSSSLPLPTGAATETTLAAMSAKLPSSLGIKTSALSLSVAPSSDGVFAISAASLPLPTGAATQTTLAAISAQLPSSLGAKTGATSFSVVAASDGFNINNITGTVSLPTGAATQTTLAAISAQLPSSLGAKTGATSLSVVAASDGFNVSQATAANLNAQVVGTVASGSADSGNPVKIGARYNATLPTFVDGNRGDLNIGTRGSLNVQLYRADTATAVGSTPSGADASTNSYNGLIASGYLFNFNGTTWDRTRGDTNGLVTMPYALSAARVYYTPPSGGLLNTTTAVTILTAAGAGVRNYLTSIELMAEALTNATEFAIRDGAAGTVIWRTKIPTGGLPTTTIKFDPPLRGTANTLMEIVTLTASGAGAVYFNAQGYTGA